ncbi:MAG: M23 family metallopeptidase [Chlamydiia bacterium]|nr:M23 family metallopeptidase [Chlamydiia bacterium]
MISTYCIVPLYLCIKLWKNRSEDLFAWTLLATITMVYLTYMYRVGAWAMVPTGYYWRDIVLVALIIVMIKSFFQKKRSLLPGWCNIRNLLALLFVGFVCTTQTMGLYYSYKSAGQVPVGVELDFPLKNGLFYIVQGGNDPLLNHHHEVNAQKYAIDIVQLNPLGLRCNTLHAEELRHYNIFGQTVYSPCNGRIIRLINGHENFAPSVMISDHPAGNYLAIQIDDSDRFVILAHLLKNSFLINENDVVVKGQPLAKVGNSGNTSEPHLHMHVVETLANDLLFDEPGVPMRFNGQFLIRNHVVKR